MAERSPEVIAYIESWEKRDAELHELRDAEDRMFTEEEMDEVQGIPPDNWRSFDFIFDKETFREIKVIDSEDPDEWFDRDLIDTSRYVYWHVYAEDVEQARRRIVLYEKPPIAHTMLEPFRQHNPKQRDFPIWMYMNGDFRIDEKFYGETE